MTWALQWISFLTLSEQLIGVGKLVGRSQLLKEQNNDVLSTPNEPWMFEYRHEQKFSQGEQCLECLLGLTFNPDLNMYMIQYEYDGKVAGSLYRTSTYLTSAILYIFKSQLMLKMEYYCYISARAAHFSLSSLNKDQMFVSLWVMNCFPTAPYPKMKRYKPFTTL